MSCLGNIIPLKGSALFVEEYKPRGRNNCIVIKTDFIYKVAQISDRHFKNILKLNMDNFPSLATHIVCEVEFGMCSVLCVEFYNQDSLEFISARAHDINPLMKSLQAVKGDLKLFEVFSDITGTKYETLETYMNWLKYLPQNMREGNIQPVPVNVTLIPVSSAQSATNLHSLSMNPGICERACNILDTYSMALKLDPVSLNSVAARNLVDNLQSYIQKSKEGACRKLGEILTEYRLGNANKSDLAIYISSIEKEAYSPVPSPPMIQFLDITDNGALLTLEPHQTGLLYEVRYAEADSEEWTMITTKDKEIKLEGLTPDTEYFIATRAAIDSEKHPQRNTKTFTTKNQPEIKPGAPEAFDVGYTSISIKWNAVNCSAEMYEVHYREDKDDQWKILVSPEPRIEVTNLTNGTSYRFKVRELFAHSWSNFSLESEAITTSTARVGAPGKPVVKCVGGGNLEVEWSCPSTEDSTIRLYEIQYKIQHTDEWHKVYTQNNEPKKAIRNLQIHGIVVARVRAWNEFESDPPFSSESDPVSTDPAYISAPGQPVANSTTDNSITLSWIKPNIGNPDGYRVEYKKHCEQSWLDIPSENESVHITDLAPDTDYVFQVKALRQQMPGPISPRSDVIRTYKTLGKPEHLECTDHTDTSIKVQWSRPQNEKGSIAYVVYYNKKSAKAWHREEVEEESLTINDLDVNSEYEISVEAIHCDGRKSGTCHSIEVLTKKYGLPLPGTPVVHQVTTTNLMVQWSFPDNVEVNFEVQYKAEDESSWQSVTASSKEKLLENLKLATSYIVKVRAVMDGKCSDFSDISHPVETGQENTTAPGKPELQVATEETLTIKWKSPDHGCVSAYKIHYKQVTTDENVWETAESSDGFFTITDLTPQRTYLVKVKPKDGPFSEVSEFTTKSATLSTPWIKRIYDISHDSFTVEWEWKRPSAGYTGDVKFHIEYKQANSETWKLDRKTGEKCARIQSLQPSTRYKVQIKAIDSYGYSNFSSTLDPVETAPISR